MISNKAFLSAVIISLAGHGLLLGLAGWHQPGQSRQESAPSSSIMVHLDDPPGTGPMKQSTARKPITKGSSLSIPDPGWSADGAADAELSPSWRRKYLMRLRERIDREWRLPESPECSGGTCITVVGFSIMNTGEIRGLSVIFSSGADELDRESLRTVRSSAPFDELPHDTGLKRLNVVAEFDYRRAEPSP